MASIDHVKAISFDGAGTLWDMDKMMRQSLQYALEELKRAEPHLAAPLSFERMMEIRRSMAGEFRGKITDFKVIGLESFKRTLKDIGKSDDALANHLNEVYMRHRSRGIQLFDDVMPILTMLNKKYTIGLLSNGRDYPENTALPEICRFAVFSQNYDFEKPDPRIFQLALEKAGCSGEELLYVGDSLINDIAGAANAGIRSVWINRLAEANLSGIPTSFEIRSLAQLLDIVDV